MGKTPDQMVRRPDCIGTPQHDIRDVPELLTHPLIVSASKRLKDSVEGVLSLGYPHSAVRQRPPAAAHAP